MNKYYPNSYWIKDNIYADYVNREGNFFRRGQRSRKKFLNKWYSGIITSWDGDNKLYHVKYDDGDSEDLDHDEMHECLLHLEQNEDKKEAHVKRQQRYRDAKKASVRTNRFCNNNDCDLSNNVYCLES